MDKRKQQLGGCLVTDREAGACTTAAMYAVEPSVEIVVQPKQRVRFRYESEKSCAAIIYGENSQSHQKTYPTIRIRNYSGKAMVIVSCVSTSEPHCPHPHKLIGETRGFNFRSGVCCWIVDSTPENEIQLHGVGIQRTKRDFIRIALEERKNARIDPFRTKFAISERGVNLHAVCLCFQVFLPDSSGKFGKALPAVVSKVIQDKKSINDLVMLRVSRSSGSMRGGDEVFLLCDTVNKDDIRVRFYEENSRGEVVWEGSGSFAPMDVYHGNAIVFKTPSYPCHMEDAAAQPTVVCMQLYRPSTEECSSPMLFTYTPHHEDPDWIDERRGRKRLKPMPHVLHPRNAATLDIASPVSAFGTRSSTVEASTALPASAGGLPTVLSYVDPPPPAQSTGQKVAYDHFLDVSADHISASEIFNAENFVGIPTPVTEVTLLPSTVKDVTFCGDDYRANSYAIEPCVSVMSLLQPTTTTTVTVTTVLGGALFRDDTGTGSAPPDAASAMNTACLALSDACEGMSSLNSLNSLLESLMNTGESSLLPSTKSEHP